MPVHLGVCVRVVGPLPAQPIRAASPAAEFRRLKFHYFHRLKFHCFNRINSMVSADLRRLGVASESPRNRSLIGVASELPRNRSPLGVDSFATNLHHHQARCRRGSSTQ